MMPRGDGIALGGTAEEGVWDLEPNMEASNRIIRAHQQLFSQMNDTTVWEEESTPEPMSEIPTLESFYELQS